MIYRIKVQTSVSTSETDKLRVLNMQGHIDEAQRDNVEQVYEELLCSQLVTKSFRNLRGLLQLGLGPGQSLEQHL